MDKVILKVDGKPDVSFMGILVASTELDEYDRLHVYETAKGHWLLVRLNMYGYLLGQTLIENKNQETLIDQLKYSDFAKSIYQQMGIDYTDNLDI